MEMDENDDMDDVVKAGEGAEPLLQFPADSLEKYPWSRGESTGVLTGALCGPGGPGGPMWCGWGWWWPMWCGWGWEWAGWDIPIGYGAAPGYMFLPGRNFPGFQAWGLACELDPSI